MNLVLNFVKYAEIFILVKDAKMDIFGIRIKENVCKCVEMEENSLFNVMMEIIIMKMVVHLYVLYKMDLHVQEDPLEVLIDVGE